MKLSLGFSPCPNDCFVFDAIVNRRIDLEGLEFAIHLADVEELNAAALAGQAQITKLSYHAYAYCTGRYLLLDAAPPPAPPPRPPPPPHPPTPPHPPPPPPLPPPPPPP